MPTSVYSGILVLWRRWNQKSDWLSDWQFHLLSCLGQLKRPYRSGLKKEQNERFQKFYVSADVFFGTKIFLFSTWIYVTGAYYEGFSEIFWNQKHPERLVSFKERAERGWKSGVRSLSWKSGWNPFTLASTRRWIYPKTFFRFRERAIWKFPEVQLNFCFVNFMVC